MEISEEQRNGEIETIAAAMIRDGISPDEQDMGVLEKYKAQIMKDCGLGDGDSTDLLYETLLYIKMQGSESGNLLEKGSQFGAGFS